MGLDGAHRGHAKSSTPLGLPTVKINIRAACVSQAIRFFRYAWLRRG